MDEVSELLQAVQESIAEMHERWNNRLESETFDVAKEYVDGRIGILVQFNREPRSHSRYSRESVWPQVKGGILQSEGCLPVWAYELQLPHAHESGKRRDESMLLGIVEKMQAVDFPACPTFVSREFDKEFLRVVSGRFYSLQEDS